MAQGPGRDGRARLPRGKWPLRPWQAQVEKEGWGLAPGKDRRGGHSHRTGPARPCPVQTLPEPAWGVFPKRFTRASGWGRHALSTVGWGTLLAFLSLLPSPFSLTPQPLPQLSPTCQPTQHLHKGPPGPPAAATRFLLLLASTHFVPPGPAPVPTCPEF